MLKSKMTVFFILLFLTVLGVKAFAYDFKPPGKGWVSIDKNQQYQTYYHELDSSDTQNEARQVCMVGIIDYEPKQCFSIVGDYNHFPDFMPYMSNTKLIHSDKINKNKTINYVFFLFKSPIFIISDRFYVLKLLDEKNPATFPKGSYRSKWDLVKKGSKYFRTPKQVGVDDSAVMTSFNQGYWLFEPLENGKKTHVTYYVWTNPGGSIPTWAADKGNSMALPELWKALNKRLKEKFGKK